MIVIEEEKVRHMIESMFREGRKPVDTEWNDAIEAVMNEFLRLPTFDTDMSEYSDRLWKLAYERGKNERFVRCNDCINRPYKIKEDREANGFNLAARETNDFGYYCPFMCADGWYSEMPPDDFYCKNGEWREETKYGKE